ncbi:M20/M25/M40 family metallo-hydrolase [Halorussus salilacus]|uniref:M20/M25/M40 family metallo-hydrolase n=1 Tax=Halorussus salilacus TaxID=2953750 RepID=UPI0020A1A9B5|nr:M20/M25/M40 family metallo-hydrolase [Halorussus salilacus]USZ69032.1 M20/M25/M40 family metallo-hydrolase [Halorussus salilacus]
MTASERFDPVTFLEAAVATPSHEDPAEMRELLVETLESRGIEARVDEAGNTLAVRDSGREGPHVVLNTHIDTVPPHVPFSRDGDVIRGRGACDAKGPLAALLAAFFGAAVERGRVSLAVTPDEETGSTGAHALSFDPVPDAVVVGEPTELDVCNAAKGRFQATVTVEGENAHAAEPHEGVNAIRAAGDLLAAFDTFDDRDDSPGVHDALGAPTLTPTTVAGGDATNQVPATCSVVVDRRSVPPETAKGFRSSLEAHLRGRAPEDAGVSVSLAERDTPFLEAWETPADAEVVRALADASGGAVRPFTAATEAAYFAAVAPTVVFGPGGLADDEGAVAHAPREYVRISAVERAAEAVEAALDALLG